MEKIDFEEKNKKYNSTIKNKLIKGYQKLRNKTNTNYFMPNIKENVNIFKHLRKVQII